MTPLEAKRIALTSPAAANSIADSIATSLTHSPAPITLESLRAVVLLSEALALCARPSDAPLLVWASDFISDHDAPRGPHGPDPRHTVLAVASLVFVQALAKLLDPRAAEGDLAPRGDAHWLFTWPSWGELDLHGGRAHGGYRGTARTFGNPATDVPP